MPWFARLFRRDRFDRELDEELAFHIEAHTRDLIAEGVAPAEARRRALATFGGREPIKELTRDATRVRWVDDFVADVRLALRAMRRHKGFTAAAVLSLAVGIGANTAVFGVLHGLLLRPLPVSNPEELHYITRTRPSEPGRSPVVTTRFSYPAFERCRAAVAGAHTSLAAMSSTTRMQIAAGEAASADAELVFGQLVSGNWFDVLGVSPAAGRLFTPADDAAVDGHPVAVLSHGYWTRRFSQDPAIVGSIVRLNGSAFTIIGVSGPAFTGFIVGEPVDVWVPSAMQSAIRYSTNADANGDVDMSKPWRAQDDISWLTLIARVADGSHPEAVNAIVGTLFRRDLEARAAALRDPQRRAFVLGDSVSLAPGARGLSDIRRQFGTAIVVLMATVALVLLVACANLAHLLLARHAARAREFGIRLSLGAGRGRIVRQLLTESVTLALASGAVSLLFASAGSRVLLAFASDDPSSLPLDVSLDATMLLVALFVSSATGVAFGLLPALRSSGLAVCELVKSGGRVVGRQSRSSASMGRVLLVAQVALSVLLIVGAALFVRTLHNLLAIDPGFHAAQVVSARFDPRTAGYTEATMAALRERLLSHARLLPGVQSAAVAICGTMANCGMYTSIDEVSGRPLRAGEDEVQEDVVDAGYFETLGMTFVAGRNFLPTDTPQTDAVAIVNETMARHFFGEGAPVGREFGLSGKRRIVGVVRDSRVNGLRAEPPRMVFLPYSQRPAAPVRNLYVRTARDLEATANDLRAAVRAAGPSIAIREVVTLSELAGRTVGRERLVSSLTGVFGLLAVAVACLGLYGSVTYNVARRTNEIGVRLALGASAGHVRWGVLREPVVLIAIGTAVGLGLTALTVEAAAGLLYGLSPRDPATLAGAALIVSIVAVLAGAVPAWRASRLDPVTALRAE
jgi:predicted permease